MSDGDAERRASRIARWTAFSTTLLVAVYFAVRLRAVPPALQTTGRTVAGSAVIVWYYLTFRVVKRAAVEWLKEHG